MEFNINYTKHINSKIIVERDCRKLLKSLLRESNYYKISVLVDKNVKDIWLNSADDFFEINKDYQLIEVKEGEAAKSLECYSKIIKELLDFGLERDSLLIAIGGGALCDLAGFVASTFMRGIDLFLIPTTLIAQADAAIGGKNGINFVSKNIIGTFYLPKLVLIDPIFLETLSDIEFINGLGEVLKYLVIEGKELPILFKENLDRIKTRNNDVLLKVLQLSVKTKANLVEEDLEEKNKRMILNFGHTIGHAIEAVSNYNVKHGIAVAYGLIVESFIANRILNFPIEDVSFIMNLIHRLNFDFNFDYEVNELLNYVMLDKKRRKGNLLMALPRKMGEFVIEEIDEDVIKVAIDEAKRVVLNA